jgi:hypothetical protein
MNAKQQLHFNLGTKPVHRYQVLDQFSDEEELLSSEFENREAGAVSRSAGGRALNKSLQLNQTHYSSVSGNRYAKLSLEADALESLQLNQSHYSSVSGNPYAKLSLEADALEFLQLNQSHYSSVSGNPYAKLSIEVDALEFLDSEIEDLVAVSSSEFKRQAGRILRQYSPTVGKSRRLRPEFRAFVEGPATKSPETRAQILNELRKYDLEASGYAPPLFNREMSDKVLKKLRQITEQ